MAEKPAAPWTCGVHPERTFTSPQALGAHRRREHGVQPGRPAPRVDDLSPQTGYTVEVGSAKIHCATAADAIDFLGHLKAAGL